MVNSPNRITLILTITLLYANTKDDGLFMQNESHELSHQIKFYFDNYVTIYLQKINFDFFFTTYFDLFFRYTQHEENN